MPPVLDEIKSWLAGPPLSLTFVRIGSFANNPNQMVALFEYPGEAPDHVLGQSAIATEYPRVHIEVRGDPKDDAEPCARAETIYRALAAAGHQLISGTRYMAFTPLSRPFYLKRDEQERVIYALNVRAMKELSA